MRKPAHREASRRASCIHPGLQGALGSELPLFSCLAGQGDLPVQGLLLSPSISNYSRERTKTVPRC